MKVECHPRATELSQIAEAARLAEAAGYDGMTSNETNHDAFLPIVLAAEHTQRLELGTAIAISFPRSPMITAQLAWDLQQYSGGRFNLGLGTQVKGHNERRFSVKWSPPAPRMREYVQFIRAVWDTFQNGTKPSFQGEHYTFTLMTPFFNPGPIEHPKIPIYLAAVGDAMCRLVGEVADGIRLHTFTTPHYIRQVILPNLEAGAKKAGRSLSDLEIIGGSFIVTGANDEEIEQAKRAEKRRIAFYGSTRTYHPVFEAHGWHDLGPKLHAMSLRNEWDAMADEISDDVLAEFAVIATYDDLPRRLREKLDGVVTRLVFTLPTRTPAEEERLRHLVQELKA